MARLLFDPLWRAFKVYLDQPFNVNLFGHGDGGFQYHSIDYQV